MINLVAFAHEAAKMGVDMLVMDDGWFGHRESDDSSLGDWYVNEKEAQKADSVPSSSASTQRA